MRSKCSEVEEKLSILSSALEKTLSSSASAYVRKAISYTVPTFYSPDELNQRAEESEEMKAILN